MADAETALLLARIQFAFTVSFHFVFPAFSIGLASYLAVLKGRDTPQVPTMFSIAMWMAALVAPVRILVGDLPGLDTLEHQPAKVMAMEGHYVWAFVIAFAIAAYVVMDGFDLGIGILFPGFKVGKGVPRQDRRRRLS